VERSLQNDKARWPFDRVKVPKAVGMLSLSKQLKVPKPVGMLSQALFFSARSIVEAVEG
jgi:hypothetical protein